MGKKKLLVIPHTAPTQVLVTRGEALAYGLAQDFDVYLLAWHPEDFNQTSIAKRAFSKLRGVLCRQKLEPKGNITVVHTPLIYVRRAGTEALRSINTAIVNRIIRRLGIGLVFNELAVVNSKDLIAPHFVDIVDLPTERELKRWADQARMALGVTTITHTLREILAEYGMNAEVIGNGADIERLRNADGGVVRRNLNLENRLLLGHIGNHAEWSGLIFLLDVFKSLKKLIPEATLLIVGPGTEVPKAKAKALEERIEDVIFTGPIKSSEVPGYFKAIDLGAIPLDVDPHTSAAFPIKAIEFGAARKLVIATPLKGLQELKLPYVRLISSDVKAWVDAIVKVREEHWQDEWDEIVDQYDWRSLAYKLSSYIKSRTENL
ncbi:MAG: glycosyltransferase [bacterium]